MAWQKFKLKVNKRYSPVERKAIAQEVIDFIVKRSRSDGKDKKNRPLKPYSKSYKESLDFKIAGKSSSPNLTLSGDMLDSIELISDRVGKLLIGFKNGTDENAKAEGNIKGTYGQRKPIPGKQRDFLGLTNKDFKGILRNYPLRDEESRKERAEVVLGQEDSTS